MPLSDEAPADQAERQLSRPKPDVPTETPSTEDVPRDRDREPPPVRPED